MSDKWMNAYGDDVGLRAYKCRGGPIHGKWHGSDGAKRFPMQKRDRAIFWKANDPIPPIQDSPEYEYYRLVNNPENGKREWVWEPLLKKLEPRWRKKKEIEMIMRRFQGHAFAIGDYKQCDDIKRVLELVYKL